MRVLPCDDEDVISFTPAMVPRARSSGVATVAAMVSGLAPGKLACTEIAGYSTCGKGATDNRPYDNAPANATPMLNKVVATGRWMNTAERFMGARKIRVASDRTKGKSRAW